MAESGSSASKPGRKGARYGLEIWRRNKRNIEGEEVIAYEVLLVDTQSYAVRSAPRRGEFVGYIGSPALAEVVKSHNLHANVKIGDIEIKDLGSRLRYGQFYPFNNLGFERFSGLGMGQRVEAAISKDLAKRFPGRKVYHGLDETVSTARKNMLGKADSNWRDGTPIETRRRQWLDRIRDFRWKQQGEAGVQGYGEPRPKTLEEVRAWKARHGKSNSLPQRRAQP
ncbi:MAG: hypothetical protein HY394_05500 [Candidatus Diapherotrites archaeon]|nr:hypothetical protein [Candidatus Diapherotrites archaeon]